tara:strand:+ start:930 stop:1739 length:810 start_codon:yes stop_codon:yes gene_type:complete
MEARGIIHSQNITLLAVIVLSIMIALMVTTPDFLSKKRDSEVIYTNIGNRWHKIDLGAFSIETPSEFKYIKEQGIDSYVGLITNKIDTFYFDYGWYSNELDEQGFIRSYDTINGVPAITVFSKTGGAGVHIPKANEDNKLTVFSSTLHKELAFDIFSTLKISGRNGRTTKPLGEKFIQGFSKGKQLFNTNCNVCHALDIKLVGPHLRNIVQRTNREWFVGWIQNPTQLIKTDEKAAKLFYEYSEMKHPVYQYSKEEIEDLIIFTEALEK